MENLDIVKILGVGLSGFGFLLMFLAYRLLDHLITQPNPNQLIIRSINWYMGVCFIMTITVGVFTFISTSYKESLISRQSQTIAQTTSGLNILTASQKTNLVSNSVIHGDTVNVKALVAQQAPKKALDTISKYIAKENDPKLNDTLRVYKDLVASLTDTTHKSRFGNKAKVDSFIRYTRSINQISLKIATKMAAKQ